MDNVKDTLFFKKMKRAIFNFDEYSNFACEKLNRTIKYFLKIVLLFSLIVTITLMFKIYQVGFSELIEGNSQTNSFTEEQLQTLNDMIKSIEETEGGTNAYIIPLGVSVFIVTFITFVAIIFFDAFTLSILGLIINLLVKTKFKYTQIFKISIYSMTLPVVLFMSYAAVYTLAGFTIKYFEYAYDAISYIYLITAILMMKSEMIKNMQEVEKVTEIEKQVKEELDREKEKNQEEKREEKKEDEKKDNKENKEQEPGEPQGNNV